MKKIVHIGMLAAIVAGSLFTTACEKDGQDSKDNDKSVALQCVKPDYLKAGDKVALISPSYHTPMENVEKTADVRSDGATLQFNIEGQPQEVRTADITAPVSSVSQRLKKSGKQW